MTPNRNFEALVIAFLILNPVDRNGVVVMRAA